MSNERAMTTMPQYRCHKKVWALKIKSIDLVRDENRVDIGAIITPEEKGYAPFEVTREYVSKHAPQVGGYLVQYRDGCRSYSPVKEFEEGYSLIDFDSAPAFRVEVDKKGCEHCDAGTQYIVVDPRGVGGSQTYEDREEAENMAELLQMTYDAGRDVGLDESFERAKKELVAFFDFLQPADGPVVEGMEEVEVKFAEKQPQYTTLRTLTSNGPERKVLSRWTLTDEQRAQVLRGADVYLELMTFGTPLQPIRMGIGYKPNAAYIMNLMWPYDGFTHGQNSKAEEPKKADQGEAPPKIARPDDWAG